jgi:hypothetical protein
MLPADQVLRRRRRRRRQPPSVGRIEEKESNNSKQKQQQKQHKLLEQQHHIVPECHSYPLTIPLSVPKSIHSSPQIVIAHRGASSHLPEHSLPAYRLALELGTYCIVSYRDCIVSYRTFSCCDCLL